MRPLVKQPRELAAREGLILFFEKDGNRLAKSPQKLRSVTETNLSMYNWDQRICNGGSSPPLSS
jgi:hypothetical protein